MQRDLASEEYQTAIDGYRAALQWFEDEGVLLGAHIAGSRILDWECGTGAFSMALLDRGATEVVAIDSWFDSRWVPANVLASLKAQRSDIQTFAAHEGNHQKFDLVFSNTVTEHIQELPGALSAAFKCLKPGGYFFSNHGNYYEPTGHHDHGFLNYANGGVEFLGPHCWKLTDKCNASAAFRASVAERYPWTMPSNFDAHLTPGRCQDCIYFKRAQPWAHLLYQAEFRTVFGTTSFTTGRPGSSLNKATSFQMRQLLIEAGFDVVASHRTMVTNDPPPALLQEPYSFPAIELKTASHRFLAQRPLPQAAS